MNHIISNCNKINIQIDAMPKAISYIRFSSSIQGEGSSTERQEYLIEKWLENHKEYVLSKTSARDLGKSGYKGEHLKHGLGAIIEAIENGEIVKGDVLLVEAMDRLGRLAPMDMMNLIRNIIESGVKVITLQDEQEYSKDKLNTDIGAMFTLVGKVQMAYLYSKSLSERIKAAYVSKRNRAQSGEKIKLFTPFWLNSDGTIKKEEGEAVKACIDMYLSGAGTRKCILDLAEKHPVLNTKHPTTLKRWFKNRALIGEWSNKGDPIENIFDPLVNRTIFYALQKELNYRKRNMSPEKKYSLSGLVKCMVCGKPFHFRRKEFNNETIVYGNCSTYLKRGPVYCENNKTWPYEVLEVIFEETKNIALIHIAQGKVLDQKEKDLNIIKERINEIDIKIKAFMEILDKIPNETQVTTKLIEYAKEKEIWIEKAKALEKKLSEDEYSIKKFLENSEEELIKLKEDPIYLGNLLKKAGFSVDILDNYAQSSAIATITTKAEQKVSYHQYHSDDMRQHAPFPSYYLLKRSTKFKCYILHRKNIAELTFSDIITTMQKGDGKEYYYAINRAGTIALEETEENLLKTLEEIKKK